MRRILTVLLAVVTACVAQPPERSPLPDVDDALPVPLGCQLAVGESQGVRVQSVLPDTPATDVLEEGDLIVAIDADQVGSRPELMDLMTTRAPGQTIDVTFFRNELTETVSITLAPNPNDVTRPMMGVIIETAFATISPDDADSVVTPSDTARLIDIADEIYLFDPLANTWQALGITPPDVARWVSTSTGLYSVRELDNGTVEIVDLLTDQGITDDGFQGWQLRRLIGTVGHTLVAVVVEDVPDRPGFINVAIAGFDPIAARTVWMAPVSSTFGVPVAAIGSLDDTAFLMIGANAETGQQSGLRVFDNMGRPRNEETAVATGEPVGWFDLQSMTFKTADDTVSVANLIDGSTTTYALPQDLIGANLAAVGDGQHILAISGRDLLVHDLADVGDTYAIATNCAVGPIGSPGWGR